MPETITLIHKSSNLSWIVTVGVTFFIGIASIIYNIHISKKTQFINTVTTERIRWMTTLKEYIAQYYSTAHTNIPPGDEETVTAKITAMLNECERLKLKIILYLNPKDDKELIDEIRANYNLLNQWSRYHLNLSCDIRNQEELDQVNSQFNNSLENILSKSQHMLKIEWERIKMESENGKLNTNKYDKLVKIHNYLRISISIIGVLIIISKIVFKGNLDLWIGIIAIIVLILYIINSIIEYLKEKEFKNLK